MKVFCSFRLILTLDVPTLERGKNFSHFLTLFFLLLLGNATVCRQITSPVSLKDVEWATQTCLLSFNTIGIWPESMDGTDLSTVAKSNNGKYCATGDDFGKIKFYSYPVSQPKVIY